MPEAVLVFEEAGRHLVPGPLVATHLAAGLVPGAAEGATVVTALDASGMVEHLDSAQALLLFDGAVAQVLETAGAPEPRRLPVRRIRSVDPTTPLHQVGVPAGIPKSAVTLTGVNALRLCAEGALLTAAQQLGSAAETLGMAVSYCKSRQQFGRPIGAFQAVQHLCAQMLARTEIARSSVYAASLTMTQSDVFAAKLLADEAAVRNARDCLQLHGGMGFTWDADIHLHLKRAWLRREQWRSPVEAEELLAEALLDDPENCSTEIANRPNGAA